MSCIQKVSCELADNREVYGSGESVSGHWTVTVGEPFRVTGLEITFVGMVYVQWDNHLSLRSKTARDVITNQRIDILEDTNYTKDGRNYIIPAGVHHYRFNFKLPSYALPSSYEGVCGAVRYLLKLAIHRSSILYAEKDRYKPITVLDYIDVNAAIYRNIVERRKEVKISGVFGLGDQGSVSLHAQTDKAAYCPGEEILLSVTARNNSQRDFGAIEASLIQKATFSSPSTTRIARKILGLVTVRGPPLLKKTTETWTNHPIKIDPIPPTTREGTCHVIKVSYFVQVAVKIASVMPFTEVGDIIVKLPITIGTTPRGLESTAVEATEATIDVDIPETCDFIYTQCEKGFEYFLDDGEGFPAIKYKPFCVYVPDLKSNANGSEGETASPPRTTASILVQPLPSENNRTSKWPTNNGRAHQEPSAPPPENTVPSKQSSTNLPAAQEPSASTASSDYLPTYEEAIAEDSGVKK